MRSSTAEVLEVEDIHVFEVLNNPLRQRLLRLLLHPMPVKALAERLDVPVTRLYYHVNLLAEAGVIRVVEERKAGAIMERVYQTAARTFRPGPKLMEKGDDPAEMARITAAVVLDPARVDAEAALAEFFSSGGRADDVPGTIGRGHTLMTRERAERFMKRIQELLAETDVEDEVEGAKEYAFSAVFFPYAGGE